MVAMEKFSLATIFIRGLNDFNLVPYFKYQLNCKKLTCKKMILHFGCFCSKATVIFRCVFAFLEETASVRLSVRLSVLPSAILKWKFIKMQFFSIIDKGTSGNASIFRHDFFPNKTQKPFICFPFFSGRKRNG